MTLRRLLEQIGGVPLDAKIMVNVGGGACRSAYCSCECEPYTDTILPASDAIVFNPQNQTLTLEV